MCELNDTELASYKTGASVWGTARGHCGQYNFWLNIRYGGAPNKTEDSAGGMLVGEREGFEAVTAESLRISAIVMCTLLIELEADLIAIFRNWETFTKVSAQHDR